MSLSVEIRHAFPGFALDVAFEAPLGVTALFGPSGSGKTSVVNAVAGLLRPDHARIMLTGEALVDTGRRLWRPAHRRRIGYVFQEGRLFPHLSVRGNLLYARAAKPASLDPVVALLGLDPLLDRRPGALSGGEKQRVAIGRALLSDARMLLMDEPLAALDAARKAEILPYLEAVNAEAGVPILYVSHAVAEVARLATTVVALRAGRVVRVGSADAVLADPALGLGGPSTLLGGRIAHQHSDGLTEIAVPGGSLFLHRIPGIAGQPVRVRIAARDVMVARTRLEGVSALNILPVRVAEIDDGSAAFSDALHGGAGDATDAYLRLALDARATDAGPPSHLVAQVTRRSLAALALAPGDQVFAVIKAVSLAEGEVARG